MNTINSSLNTAGDAMLAWLGWMNLWTLTLLLVVMLLDLSLARRVEARWRMLLYAAIVARLTLPTTFETPLGLWGASSDAAPDTAASQVAPIILHETGINLSPAPVDDASSGPGGPSRAAALRAAGLVPIAWMGGALMLLSLWVAARRRLARHLSTATAARLSIARLSPRDRIVEHPDLGPAVAGVMRPVIVLPRALAEESEHDVNAQQSVRWIIRHEAAHVARRDHLVAAGVQLVTILFWPIVALWIGAHRVRRLMEQACDDRALAGARAEERRAYGQTLIAMASRSPSRPTGRGAALINVGLLGHAHGGLRARVRALASPVRRWPAAAQLTGLMLVLPALVAATSIRSAPPPPPKAPAQSAPTNAPAEVDVTIRVFKAWPKHPKTTFDIAQRSGDAPPPASNPDPKAHTMTAEEYAAYLTLIQENPGNFLIAAPRVRTFSGQSASVRVGQDDDQGEPKDGLLLEVTPTLQPDGTITLNATYRAFGLPTQPPASNFEDGDEIGARLHQVSLENGETIFAIATGYIGAPMHMVAITVQAPSVGARNAAEPPVAREPALQRFDPGGGVYPQIQFYAFARDLNAPPRLDQVVPDAPRLELKLTDGEAGFSASTHAFTLSTQQEKTLFDWLSRNSRETTMGNKNGVAITPPGQWTGLHVRPRRVDGRDRPGFSVRFLGRLEGEQVVLAAVYEETVREPGAADADQALALPTGARLVGRLTLNQGQACAIALPATDRSPARVLVIRAEVLRGAEDWPVQTARGLEAAR